MGGSGRGALTATLLHLYGFTLHLYRFISKDGAAGERLRLLFQTRPVTFRPRPDPQDWRPWASFRLLPQRLPSGPPLGTWSFRTRLEPPTDYSVLTPVTADPLVAEEGAWARVRRGPAKWRGHLPDRDPRKARIQNFFLFKANIPLYAQTTSCLCTHPRMDPWVASAFWLRESAAEHGWAGVCLESPLSILFF